MPGLTVSFDELITCLEKNIITKFDSNNRFQAVAKAVMLGIVGH